MRRTLLAAPMRSRPPIGSDRLTGAVANACPRGHAHSAGLCGKTNIVKEGTTMSDARRQAVFTVHGTPAPQGSKKGFYNRHTGRVQIVESSQQVKPWRQAVVAQALEQVEAGPFVGPVEVKLRFMLTRPKGHYGTGRNAGQVKESAPAYPAVRPDLDKYVRATLDGLGDAGLVSDDAQIVTLRAEKRYTEHGPRCDVTVREARPRSQVALGEPLTLSVDDALWRVE